MPKISALPEITNIDPLDQLPVNDVSAKTTKRMSLTALVGWLQSRISWITTAMLADSSVTTPKIKPSVINFLPNTTGTRATTSTALVDVPDAVTSYTSGPTAERLILEFSAMTLVNGSAGHVAVSINGVDMPDELVYNNASGIWQRQTKTYIYDVAANTTILLRLRFRIENSANTFTIHMDSIYRPAIRGIAISNA